VLKNWAISKDSDLFDDLPALAQISPFHLRAWNRALLQKIVHEETKWLDFNSGRKK
jgi:hypothetical protein